jgi:solute carrier family 25 carnitine/acylcarnitine transporter 20/29
VPPRPHHQLPQYASPLAVLRETLAVDGRRGLFKGLSLTLAREIPANALYFVTYETILRGAGFRDERERADASAWLLLLAGGLAGMRFVVASAIDGGKCFAKPK